ncbi:MAG: hypothetical protein MRECE_48c007 [Mycoplasmataceae bacterium CE_OT135]|nr:MAG: hypothetical protein MRECE_48c001 [Mycoplasmataceae bacterium CE_OT135]KLL02744.1 MAG: hypothetical protein MRECE_48c007 [Mycoplasmataceae bacterium CE_OT135]
MIITKREFDRIKDLKTLDIQVCDFCQRLNILNLGWKPFGKFYCRSHETDYTLCPELCYKVCLNIWGCQLYKEETKETGRKDTRTNLKHYKSHCYFCFKELKGAGKTGKVKNRNNPSFWEISTEYRILCLGCIKKKYYQKLEKEKRKMLNKYLRRGYE